MGETAKNKFLTFNIGHVITILIYIITGSIYVGMIKTTLAEHTKQIEKNQREIVEMKDKYYEILSSGGGVDKSQNLSIQALDLRVSRVETSLSKIDIIVNELSWIKQWVIDKNKAP